MLRRAAGERVITVDVPSVGQSAVATASSGGASPAQLDGLAATLARTELLRSPSSIPGRHIVQVLTEIPPGVSSGWHLHPGEEVGYIVGGTVEMSIEGRGTLTLQAGDGFLIPPGTRHNALDVGEVTGRMLSTYIVDPGEPLATLTDQPNTAERVQSGP